jgi:hypothetical protein
MTAKDPIGVRSARAFTLLLTSVIKLVGLASAFNQLLLQGDAKPLSLVVAAFMMSGAQVSEGLILSFIDRLMAGDPHQPPAGSQKP